MCLIAWAQSVSKRYPLVLVANRDEFLERPTTPMHRWPADERGGLGHSLLAGRDARGGGTWMAVTPTLGLSAITNVREPLRRKLYPLPEPIPSRGGLTLDAIRELANPALTVTEIAAQSGRYEGFNLLRTRWVDARGRLNPAMHWLSNRAMQAPATELLEPQPSAWHPVGDGVHGLSNAGLNTPWPKLRALTQGLAAWIRESDQGLSEDGLSDVDALMALLANPKQAPDEQLPDTGIGLDKERMLSAIRIIAPHYATRSSTVVLLHAEGDLTVVERSHHLPQASVAELHHEDADHREVGPSWTDRRFTVSVR